MIDFPASPTPGQRFTAAGATWIFDGVKWLPEGLAPTVAPGINDNRIINGDMRIDQRNNGAGGTVTGYTVDRWAYYAQQVGKGSWGRNFPTIAAPAGFPYYLGFSSTSAYSPLIGDTFEFAHAVEADTVSDFAWGTSSAQPVTLSFWANSNSSGTFSGAVKNYAQTRSYVFSYSLPGNTWTKVVVTIPGDTGGPWVMSGNAGAAYLMFDLGSGSTFRTTPGSWQAGSYLGANGAISVVATNGTTFFVTGVKLEIGSVATPYNRQSLAKSMADCQRYYYDPANGGSTPLCFSIGGYAAIGTTGQTMIAFPVTMRAGPTVTVRNQSYAGVATGLATSYSTPAGAILALTTSAAGASSVNFNLTASAEL